MLFPLASGELRGIPDERLQLQANAAASFHGLQPCSRVYPHRVAWSMSRHSNLRPNDKNLQANSHEVSIAPRQRLHHRKATWPVAKHDLRQYFVPRDHHSSNPVRDSKKLSDSSTVELRCALRFSQPLGALFRPMHPERISAQSHSWGSRPTEVSPLWLPTLPESVPRFRLPLSRSPTPLDFCLAWALYLSCERLATRSARLQGFELPESSF